MMPENDPYKTATTKQERANPKRRHKPKRKKKVENYRMPSEKKVMRKISRKYHDQLKKRATTDIKNEYRKNETRVARAESKVKYMFTIIIFEAIVIGILLIDFYLI